MNRNTHRRTENCISCCSCWFGNVQLGVSKGCRRWRTDETRLHLSLIFTSSCDPRLLHLERFGERCWRGDNNNDYGQLRRGGHAVFRGAAVASARGKIENANSNTWKLARVFAARSRSSSTQSKTQAQLPNQQRTKYSSSTLILNLIIKPSRARARSFSLKAERKKKFYYTTLQLSTWRSFDDGIDAFVRRAPTRG